MKIKSKHFQGSLYFFITIWILMTVSAKSLEAQPNFKSPVIVANDATNWWAKTLGDMNNDGVLDVIFNSNSSTGGSLLYLETSISDGGWFSWTKNTIAEQGPNGGGFTSGALDLGDINGDGRTDAVGFEHPGNRQQSVSGTLVWYENPDWTKHIIGEHHAYVKEMALADFNGDGKPDIATADWEKHTLVVHRQESGDDWTKVSQQTITNLHEGMDTGDIDGDGDIDIAANGYWIENPGGDLTGDWTVRTIDPKWYNQSGSNYRFNATKIFCRDINKDGRAEVFVSHSENTGYPLSWYESTDPKNGSWTEHVVIDSIPSAHSLEVYDFDNDGDFDVITGSNATRVGAPQLLFVENMGNNRTWQQHVIDSKGTYNPVVGDVDEDGDYDLFRLRAHDSNILEFFENTTDPNSLRQKGRGALGMNDFTYFEIDNDRTGKMFGLGLGDGDGDGDIDIASGGFYYINPGGDLSGNWKTAELPGDGDANLIVDIDDDGLVDIISQDLPHIRWIEAVDKKASAFVSTVIASELTETRHGNSQGYAVGELTGGGKPELVFTSGRGINYLQIPADPENDPWPNVNITPRSPEEDVAIGDIDGDGDNDVVSWIGTGRNSNVIGWCENPGDGSSNWTQRELGTIEIQIGDRIRVADFNRDGKIDVAATATTNRAAGSYIYWYENPGDPKTNTGWKRHTVASNQPAMNSLDVEDMNRDGLPDIIAGDHRGDALKTTIWENVLRASAWKPHTVDQGKEAHLGTQIADLEGDGDFDIVSIGYRNNQYLHVWRNNAIIQHTAITSSELVFTEHASDGGRNAYKVETPHGTWYLEKSGAGLSSAIDRDGADWIGWDPSEFPYQGFPNAVWSGIEENPRGYFHPFNEATSGHSFTIEQTGESVILEATSDDGHWVTAYEFFPTHVTWHVKNKPGNGSYWVLYEGWPGGSFEPETDWWMTSESPEKKACTEPHEKDIPGPEWIVFGDQDQDRVLFLLSHQDDAFVDVYFPLRFTVFGFGREGTARPYFSRITEADRSFSIGFLETTDYDAIDQAMKKILRGSLPTLEIAP